LRHSYASYHIAKYQDAAGLALQLGHTTTKLIFSSYRLRVKQSEADVWWALMPQFRNDAGTKPYGDQTLSSVLLPP
jgi:integrase